MIDMAADSHGTAEALTQFPHLLSTRQLEQEENEKAGIQRIAVRYDARLPRDVVVLAWAILLKNYTGSDVLRFAVDDAIILVDSETWSIRTLEAFDARGTSCTALVFGNKQRHDGSNVGDSHGELAKESISLQLQYDPEENSGILCASKNIPQCHLPELATQLQQAMHTATKLKRGEPVSTDPYRGSLSILNGHPGILEGPRLLHELVFKDFQDHSSAIEFQDADGSRRHMTYVQLASASQSLASILRSSFRSGSNIVQNQCIVPVLIPQCPELYISLLGILQADAAFCPLNLDMPEERVRFVIKDVGARVVVTTAALQHRLPKLEGVSICLVDEIGSEEDVQRSRDSNPSAASGDSLAYVMYTSGSTGQPKGVGVSHLAVTQSLLAHDQMIPLYSRFLQFASPTFDVSMFEIFFTFFRGSTLVCCDRILMLNDLTKVMNDLNIDAAELTPTVAGSLLRSREEVPDLKLLLTIGEMLTTAVVEEFGGSRGKPSLLYGMYGPTEAAIHCTLQTSFQTEQKVGIIGTPLSTVSAYIVSPADPKENDRNVKVLPLGQIGELAVGGHQLAVGYLNRQEQTDAAFVDDSNFGRLYRTGDKARMLPDGLIECLGRIQGGQVKLRGQRLELGEIEQVACKVRGCRVASAIVLNSNLVLFCLTDDTSLSQTQIRDVCKKWLPSFMVPQDIVLLRDMPRLASGKVDKKELEKLYEEQVNQSETQDVEVNYEAEHEVLKVVEELLGHPLRKNMSLARNGLDSLTAIRLASRLRLHGFKTNAVEILGADSIRQLVLSCKGEDEVLPSREGLSDQFLSDLRENVMKEMDKDASARNIESIIPCTPLQISMLAETALDPEAYCNRVLLQFSPEISSEKVVLAIKELIINNSVLRSGFVRLESTVNPYVLIVFDNIQSSQLLQVESFDQNFSIETQLSLLNPLRVQVSSNGSHVQALLHMHHAIYDGWSIDLIVGDLERSISGTEVIQRPQFELVAAYQDSIQKSPRHSESREFWRRYLKDHRPVSLASHDEFGVTNGCLDVVRRSISLTVDQLQSKLGKTFHPQVLFQASFAYMLKYYLSTFDVVFGSVTSGRAIPITGVEEIIGPCITTLPLRADVSPKQNVASLLFSIHESNRSLLEHSTVPLQQIKRACGVNPGQNMFDTLFIWQESLYSRQESNELVKVVQSEDVLEFNLVLELEPQKNSIDAIVRFRNSFVSAEQVQILLSQLEEVATFMLHSPEELLENIIGNLTNQSALHQASKHAKRAAKSNDYSQTADTSNELERDVSDSALHRSIVMALSQIVHIPVFDIHRNATFFSFGLDSVSAILLARKLKSSFDIDVTVSQILTYPTPASLASAVVTGSRVAQQGQSRTGANFQDDALSQLEAFIVKNDLKVEAIRPCTPLQEAMLAANLNSGVGTYFNNTLFKIRGDVNKLKQSFQNACDRHEILRTIFTPSDDTRFAFAQLVLEDYRVVIEETVLSSQDELTETIHAQSPALQENTPAFKIDIITVNSAKYLLLSMHHALYDGEAMAILLSEIEKSYHMQSLPQAVPMQPFLDNALSLSLDRVDNYWDTMLKGFVPVSFPSLGSYGMSEIGGPDTIVTALDLNIPLDHAQQCCRNASSTMLSLLQASWAKVLSLAIGETDLCFGNVVSGRTIDLEDVERLIAPCFNTIPVRVAISTNETNEGLVEKLNSINASTLDHQFSPLRRIKSRFGNGSEQLFDTLFILQRANRKLDDSIWSLEDDFGDMGFPVVCEVIPDEITNSISIKLQHNSSLISRESAQIIVRTFEKAVLENVESPAAKALELSMTEMKDLVKRYRSSISFEGEKYSLDDLQTKAQKLYPQVRKLAVMDSRRDSNDSQITIFVQVHQGSAAPSQELISELLPSANFDHKQYKILFLDNLPLSHIGLPSLRALVVTLKQSTGTEDAIALSNDETNDSEKIIMSTYSRFTKVSQIDRMQTIYQLGLDSISAIQVAKALREQNINVSAEDVLAKPTAAGLAQSLHAVAKGSSPINHDFNFKTFDTRHRNDICERSGLDSKRIESILPCTHIQSGMIAQFLSSHGKTYFNHFIFKLSRNVDRDQFQRAWVAVTEHHPMLRTGFAGLDDPQCPFAMVCHRHKHLKLPWHELGQSEKPVELLKNQRESSSHEILEALSKPAWRGAMVYTIDNTWFQFSAHHALYDAESFEMILSDIHSLLERKVVPKQICCIEPILQSILHGSNNTEAHRQFWSKTLQDVSGSRFPNLCPLRKHIREIQSVKKSCTKSRAVLENGCRIKGVSMQAALQVAWAQLLSAYTGESDVTFGIVLSGREMDDAANVVFPCTSTVPFRHILREDSKSSLDAAMSFNSEVRKHRFSPLTQIQRWADFRDGSLFDTILVYQKTAGKPKDERLWTVVQEDATVEYAVSLEVKLESTDALAFEIHFWDDILPPEQAEILLEQYEHFLSNLLITHPENEKNDHSRIQLLKSWTPPKEKELPSNVSLLHGFVEEGARRYANKVALEFVTDMHEADSSQRWTYKQLNNVANQYANKILGQGVKSGSLIAISFDKCPEASFTIIGILKAGCAFLALDHSAPVARKAFISEDSKAAMIITSRTEFDRLKNHVKIPIICVEDFDLNRLPILQPRESNLIGPSSASYCLYTSGSTGTPKGCILSHENAVQLMTSFQRIFAGRWDQDSRWLQFASFHFDVSVLEQFWSWSVGICVVSAPRDMIFEDLAGSLRGLGITHVDLTPSLALLVTPEEVPSLCKGVFITGGEQLKQEVLDAWGSQKVIHNGYGPTECTIGVTMFPRVPQNGKPSNIGWQFDNVGTFVLKPGTDDLVLRGGVGELCISGKLVGIGYLNRPELTAERFPYLERYNERIYRTGDLVRILHDGSFDFLGRIDDQVKLRGQRLELGEINSAIRASTEVISDATTLVVKVGSRQIDQLVAFVALDQETRNNAKELKVLEDRSLVTSVRNGCQDRLPGYMVPSQFLVLSKIPLTVNNKIDVKSLRQLVASKNGASEDGEKESRTRSKQEVVIAEILAKQFAVDSADIFGGSSVFQLGVDSISVFGFSRALRKSGLTNAHPSVIMQAKTVRDLARALSKGESVQDTAVLAAKQSIIACKHRYLGLASKTLNVNAEDIETIAPSTSLQEGIIARSLENGKGLYFNSFILELLPGTDISKLKSVWNDTVKDVPILRTAFISGGDGYVQVVSRLLPLRWTEFELPEEQHFDRELERLKDSWIANNSEIINHPFQLILIRQGSKTSLIVQLFHALYDATSLSLLFDSVTARYRGGKNTSLGPAFHDVLAYGPLRQPPKAKEFWTKALIDSHVTKIAKDEQNRAAASHIAKHEILNLKDLEVARRKLNVTHQALMQVCWTVVLQDYLKSPTIVGHVVSGRSLDVDGVERTVGPMFNTLPFYLGLDESDTWKSALHKCHDANVATLPFQHTSLRNITKWLHQTRGQNLFDTLFVFQKAAENESLVPEPVWTHKHAQATADYPLSFEAELTDTNILSLTIVALDSAIDLETSKSLLATFERVFWIMLHNSEQKLVETMGDGFRSSLGRHEAQKPEYSPHQNGSKPDFEWTHESTTIRHEFSDITGIETTNISENTTIFELGLDSIDAIKLSSRLKRKGIHLLVSAIIRNPSIAQMMQTIASSAKVKSIDSQEDSYKQLCESLGTDLRSSGHNLISISQILPATPLQEALVADMRSSDHRNYMNHDILKLSPEADLQKLRKAWKSTVRNSPILRTSFCTVHDPEIDQSFAQLIHETEHRYWNDISAQDERTDDSIIETIRDHFNNSSEMSVPFRLTYFTRSEERYIIISISHALYDGWSIGLLHSDIHQAYHDTQKVRPDYQGVLRNVISSADSSSQTFWQNYVRDASSCSFNPQHDSGRETEPRVHLREQQGLIDANELRSFCKAQGVTPQAIGQTCWALLLASYTGTLDVLFGIVLSGRDNEEAQDVLFPTMNTVVSRLMIHGSRQEMLKYAQDNLADLLEHQHFPLRSIQNMAPTRGSELFNSLFIFQRRSEGSTQVNELYTSINTASASDFPVCAEMEIMNGKVIWRMACQAHFVDESEAIELLQRLDTVLQNIIKDPEAPVFSLDRNDISICGLASSKFVAHDESKLSSTDAPTIEESGRNDAVGWSQVELTVREVLSAVSKIPEPQIKKDQTIFNLGLDSISAIKVAALLRKKSLRVSVSDIVRAGTIPKIAQRINGSEKGSENGHQMVKSDKDTVANNIDHPETLKFLQERDIDITQIEAIWPATAGQVLFYSLWQNTQGAVFFPTFTYQISSLVEPDKLFNSWKQLMQLHPILRTTLITTQEKDVPVYQVVQKELVSNFTYQSENNDGTFTQREKTSKLIPFVYMDASEQRDGSIQLDLTIHHSLYDAVSLPLLIKHLESLCNDQTLHSKLSSSFLEYLALGGSNSARKQRQHFWTGYLDDLQSKKANHVHWPLSGNRTELYKPTAVADTLALTLALRDHGLSLQSLFFATFARTYASWKDLPKTQDVLLGVYLANRSLDSEDFSSLAAPTVNIVPLRIQTPLQRNAADTAKQVQEDLRAIGEEDRALVSLWEVEAWTGLRIDCFVNFLRLPDSEDEAAKVRPGKITIQESKPKTRASSRKVLPAKDMHENTVNDCYIPSIDVEAAVRGGALDMGVFGPEELIDLSQAQEMIQSICATLVDFR